MELHTETEFWKRLSEEILFALPDYYGKENWDAERYGPYQRPVYEIPLHLLNTCTRAEVTPPCSHPRSSFALLYSIMEPYRDGFAYTYTILADEYSRSLFVRLVAYRLLGFHKVKLPLSLRHDELEKMKDTIQHLIDPSAAEKTASGTWKLSLMDLGAAGFPIRCYSSPNGILTTFLLKQYEYRKEGTTITVSPGDYIIDGGGAWGDTALFFASAAGEGGKVFSFEFDPQNIAIFQKNLSLNPELSQRIRIIEEALWIRSGESISYSGNGPGTTIAQGYDMRAGKKELQATTRSIDDFVQQEGLARVDYIKMDIEAAELNALKGAADTIRRFRPVLAIALYHTIGDYALIPRYLTELTEDYVYYLDHFTIHSEETVLFAVPKEKRGHVP